MGLGGQSGIKMVSVFANAAARTTPVRAVNRGLRSVRPTTLLVACGIILIAALLNVTGIVAGRLRAEAIASARTELAQLDAVIAESTGHAFAVADTVSRAVADRLLQAGGANPRAFAAAMRAPQAAVILASGLGPASPYLAIAVLAPDGTLLDTAGWWPPSATDLAGRDLVVQMRAEPRLDRFVGAPVVDAHTGARLIPIVHRIGDGADGTLGYVVGLLPAVGLESFFQGVALGTGSTVSLQRADGIVLAQYPASSAGAAAAPVADAPASAIDIPVLDNEHWRIAATRNLSGFPLALTVTRRGDAALGDWSGQTMLLGVLAICGALGVALMVFLIARQIRIYGALASARAEKMEAEHARLVTEAELLKKERLSVLGQLTATVAHELRNPLSAIRNTLFSTKEMASGAGLKLDRPIARMERSIERCNRIIGDLLEYARTRELKRTTVNLEAWLKEILSEQTIPATMSLAEDFRARGAQVAIDPERMRRVVINLVENAAQALGEMPADAIERRITVRTLEGDDAVELAVADNGAGIPPENLARIFEPLFSTKSFGTGLGLATVKQIVGQHGGTIEVESEIGRGTCFAVRLPRQEEVKVME